LLEGSDNALYGTTYYGGAWGRGAVFRVNKDGSGFTNLYSFTGVNGDGSNPKAALVQGSDGMLYGTTYAGGSGLYFGTVFRVSTNGGAYQVLKSFTGAGGDGAYPLAGLTQGSDGALYGTTYYGGSSNKGSVFKLNVDGSAYTVLHSFSGLGADGAYPQAALVQGSDGALYGTTGAGGTTYVGTVFKLAVNGSSFVTLHSFTGTDGDGAEPKAELLEGAGGALYGTTFSGGLGGGGTVFQLNADGSGYAGLYSFGTNNIGNPLTNGLSPAARLVQDTTGVLYGTTSSSEEGANGTLFSLHTDGSGYLALLWFEDGGTSGFPEYLSIGKSDGVLYGTLAVSGSQFDNAADGAIFSMNTDGSDYKTVHSFTGTDSDGNTPIAGLIQATNGALYGVASNGGGNRLGTVFTLNADGSGYTNLYSFGGTPDGASPVAGLLQAGDGLLYGTTLAGGTQNLGTVFRLNASGGDYTVLYSFTGLNRDGANPVAGLIQGKDGFLYGTASSNLSGAFGAVYRLSTDGTGYTNLHVFTGAINDGATPLGALLQVLDGALYGTAWAGGNQNLGTVFRLNSDGTGYTNLYSFAGPNGDGANPAAGLVQARDGTLYGTTFSGGTNSSGTVFKLSTNGANYQVLRDFTGAGGDGAHPQAPLVLGTDGDLYGTTYQGGDFGLGTIFKLGTNGIGYSSLHAFTLQMTTDGDGANPTAPLLQARDGTFFGTTSQGGNVSNPRTTPAPPNQYGTVFHLITSPADPIHLSVPALTLTTNLDASVSFSATIAVSNQGVAASQPLRLRLVAKAGYSYCALLNSPVIGSTPADQVVGVYPLASPANLAPGTTTNISIVGACPAPISIDPLALGFGWGIFAVLEEQAGTNWFFKESDLLFEGEWPRVGGFVGPGGGVVKFDPVLAGNPAALTSLTIHGPPTVAAGSMANFFCTAQINNGAPQILGNAVWAAFPLTNIADGVFQPGYPPSDTVVTVTCSFTFGAYFYSTQTTVRVLYVSTNVPSGPLTVNIDPSGAGRTDLQSGVILNLNSNYTINAFSNPGYVFSNWTEAGASVLGTAPALTFTMQSGLTLQANFTPIINPLKGSYYGLFYGTNNVTQQSSGSFTATTTAKGGYSARIQIGASVYSFQGTFDSGGHSTNIVRRPKQDALQVEMLNLSGAGQIIGSISSSSGSWTTPFVANLSTNSANYKGAYTLIIGNTESAEALSLGYGWGTVAVDTSGRIRFSGSLADGTIISQAASISANGEWPLYLPLYGGQGSIFGWILFNNQAQLNGALTWIKPAQSRSKYYPGGFINGFQLIGSAYSPPGAGHGALAWTNGQASFSGGNLSQPFTNLVTLGANGKISNNSSNKMTLTLVPSTGAFRGNVVPPGTNKTVAVQGVLLQNAGNGYGYFLGANQSGQVFLGP